VVNLNFRFGSVAAKADKISLGSADRRTPEANVESLSILVTAQEQPVCFSVSRSLNPFAVFSPQSSYLNRQEGSPTIERGQD
jgi:hypothetical protein